MGVGWRRPHVAPAHEALGRLEDRTVGEERQRVAASGELGVALQQLHQRVVLDVHPLESHGISGQELPGFQRAPRRRAAEEICRRVPHPVHCRSPVGRPTTLPAGRVLKPGRPSRRIAAPELHGTDEPRCAVVVPSEAARGGVLGQRVDNQTGGAPCRDTFPTETTGLPSRSIRKRNRRPLLTAARSSSALPRCASGSATTPCACSATTAGRSPGPTLRVPEGSEIRSTCTTTATWRATVHWHGLRLENRSDGTHETQRPIPVGGDFSCQVQFPYVVHRCTTRTFARTTARRWGSTATSLWSLARSRLLAPSAPRAHADVTPPPTTS